MLFRDKRRRTIGRYGYKRKGHRLRNNEPFFPNVYSKQNNSFRIFLKFLRHLDKIQIGK